MTLWGIVGWMLQTKEAKMRNHTSSLLKIHYPPIHFTTIYGVPALCSRSPFQTLLIAEMKGDGLTLPSMRPLQARKFMFIFFSPFYSQKPKTWGKRLAQGRKTSRWQGQELNTGAKSKRCFLPTQSLPQPSIFCSKVGIKDTHSGKGSPLLGSSFLPPRHRTHVQRTHRFLPEPLCMYTSPKALHTARASTH